MQRCRCRLTRYGSANDAAKDTVGRKPIPAGRAVGEVSVDIGTFNWRQFAVTGGKRLRADGSAVCGTDEIGNGWCQHAGNDPFRDATAPEAGKRCMCLMTGIEG